MKNPDSNAVIKVEIDDDQVDRRYVILGELCEVEEIDEDQVAAWMRQVAAVPGMGKRR